MNLFNWWGGKQRALGAGLRGLAKKIKADGSTFQQSTADAILALTDQPVSQEIVSFLEQTAGKRPYAGTAGLALAITGDIWRREGLASSIRCPRVAYKEDAKLLSSPRNAWAIAPMLEIAQTSANYLAIESALQVLAGIGTPQAREAIEKFREGESRIVTVLWSGFETPEPVSTTFLGQRPFAPELGEARQRLNRENVFSFGLQNEVLSALDQCLDMPQTAPLVQLESFLAKGVERPRGALGVARPGITKRAGVPDLPRRVIDYWIEESRRNFGQRDKEIRDRLAAANKERLEVHILNQIPKSRDQALAFYRLLPNRTAISQLTGLDHPFQSEDEIPDYIAELRRQDVIQQRLFVERRVEDARAHPGNPDARLAVFLEAYRHEREFRLSLLAEFIEPLLAHERWDVRKRAIETLKLAPSEQACRLLERYAAGETNYELQTYAQETAQSISRSLGSERQ